MSNKFLDKLKEIGSSIAHLFEDTTLVAQRFENAVIAAKDDTSATIAAGKPLVQALAEAYPLVANAVSQYGANWITDQAAIAAVTKAMQLVGPFLGAIEKEGKDVFDAAVDGTPAGTPTPISPIVPVRETVSESEAEVAGSGTERSGDDALKVWTDVGDGTK